MATLREQIESLPTYEGEWVLREAVLFLIDQHEDFPQNVVAFLQLGDDLAPLSVRLEVPDPAPSMVDPKANP